jgi:phosphate acetyltransferase
MGMPQSARVFLETMAARARQHPKKIVFPEGGDARVLEAAARLAAEGAANPILVSKGKTAPSGCRTVDPDCPDLARKYGAMYYERRRAKGITQAEAEAMARQPLYCAALMVAAGDADGSVGGAAHTTADTVRAALHCVGTADGVRLVSSMFLMALENESLGHKGLMAFADCAVVIEPSAGELAQIAIATAATARRLLCVEPVVALLSFSTKGSGKHASLEPIREALRILRERAPDLNVDGELQVDAAVTEAVGRSKAPGSTVAGRANTLIFPNLMAANIGYKLVERLGGATAIGPVLQGLAKPVNDLSRGCSTEDVYNAALITAAQAAV